MPTHWHSTLAMQRQLHVLQQAINEWELGFFSQCQWLLIEDACSALLPFEKETRMVHHDNAYISSTIPVVLLLEHTMHSITNRVLEAQQQKKEDYLASQGQLYSNDIPVRTQQSQDLHEVVKEYSCCGDIEEDDMGKAFKSEFCLSQNQEVVCGWGETSVDNAVLHNLKDSCFVASVT